MAQRLGPTGVVTGIGEIGAICGQVFLSTDFADYADGNVPTQERHEIGRNSRGKTSKSRKLKEKAGGRRRKSESQNAESRKPKEEAARQEAGDRRQKTEEETRQWAPP